MSLTPLHRPERLDDIADELSVLCGQVNMIQARIVELAAEVEASGLLGDTACRSLEHWIAWQTGASTAVAHRLAGVARRSPGFPELTAAFTAGLVSLDQVHAVVSRVPASPAADRHFTELAQVMTVRQLSIAARIAAPPPPPEDEGSTGVGTESRRFSFGYDDRGNWSASIHTSAAEGAYIEAGLRTHLDALHNEHRRASEDVPIGSRSPLPTWFDALERMVDRSLEREASDRPWASRTKVVVHIDADRPELAVLHLGPALTAAERSLLTCDASVTAVLERFGRPVSVGREHRITPERTRLLVEQRDGGCVVPWCRATRKLVTHHIVHWEHGGPTDSGNLVTLCPFHHREVHAGRLGISGDADRADELRIVDARGRPITGASGARSPSRPPDPPPDPYRCPDGGSVDWKWYSPPPLVAAS